MSIANDPQKALPRGDVSTLNWFCPQLKNNGINVAMEIRKEVGLTFHEKRIDDPNELVQ